MKKMKILIAGGAGFIGSHLCDLMVSLGHSVVCVDNLITGDIANISGLLKNRSIEFIRQDISRGIRIKGKLDAVMHLASPASPVDYMRWPIETLKANSTGTGSLLELARGKKSRFLLASTSEVYGDPKVNPQPETYWGNVNPIGSRSVYDEGKRFSEALTMAYHRVYKIDIKIARIFNTYGPRMQLDDGRVVPNFINQALRNKPLTVYGKGTQTRSFCYVSDLAEGLYKLLLSSENQPVNLGNPCEYTILKFAGIIKKLTASKSKIVFKELPEDDPKLRRPDITKAEEILKWHPKIGIESGLKNTIMWFKAYRAFDGFRKRQLDG